MRQSGRSSAFASLNYPSFHSHRDDVVFPDIPTNDYDLLKDNPNEVSAAYQKHLLAGIRWALGLVDGDTTLGNHK